MSVLFIGNCEWEPASYPSWSGGSYGTDRASVLYRGRLDKKEAFLTWLKTQQWTRMPGFKIGTAVQWTDFNGMFLEDFGESSGTPNFPGLELRYVGFRDGRVPTPRAVGRISTQVAQGAASISVSSGSGVEEREVSVSFTYRASGVQWSWFETIAPPSVPRYATVPEPYRINPLSRIDRYSITDAETGSGRNASTEVLTEAFNSLVPVEIVSDYTHEPIIPGRLWACSATVDYALQN